MKSIPTCVSIVIWGLSLQSFALAQWVKTGAPQAYVTSLAVRDTNVFAGYFQGATGIYRSTDLGGNWSQVNSGITVTPNVDCLTVGPRATDGSSLFVGVGDPFGSFDGGVFRSSNDGTNWTDVSGIVFRHPTSFAVSDTDIWVGTWGMGVYRSTNNGTSWTETNSGLTSTAVLSMAIGGDNLFVGTSYGGVFLSTNKGANWNRVDAGFGDTFIQSLAVANCGPSGSIVLAGTGNGTFISTNNGTSWTQVSGWIFNCFYVTSTESGEGILLAGTIGNGIVLSTDNGLTWSQVNAGLTNLDVRSLAVDDIYLFAGSTGGVWRRPLSQIVTSVKEFSAKLPTDYQLGQNYPNPFNPSTTLRYGLPHKSHVSLSIFNPLGQKVTQLVNGEEEAGYHDVIFEGNNLASGVYFYSMRAGSFVETRKMLLIK